MENKKDMYSMEEVLKNKDYYSKLFSEDDIELEKLLTNLWNNNISTRACCKGHKEKTIFQKYILITCNNINNKILSLITYILKYKDIQISIFNSLNELCICFEDFNIDSKLFEYMNKFFIEDYSYIDSNCKRVVDFINSYKSCDLKITIWNSNIFCLQTHNKYFKEDLDNRNPEVLIFRNNQEINDLFKFLCECNNEKYYTDRNMFILNIKYELGE